MAVVIETTAGDITVDLFTDYRPRTCLNFIKLCKLKYYNYNLFHTIQSGFIAQTGDPTGAGDGGSSLWGLLHGPDKRYFQAEKLPPIKHTVPGLLSMVATGNGDDQMVGSQFFFTLGPDLNSLDGQHCVIGEVTEGHDILRVLNETICDAGHRPYQDVRITHTVILEDPYDDPEGFRPPDRSPSPSAERLAGGRIAPDEEIDEFAGKTEDEITEMIEAREAKARATILEIVGDLPDADMAPPENVLFVCKLNPVTTDDDLEIIFSRFGKIKNCEVIRDRKSGDSLQYAFIEFEEKKSCEDAYFKMDNVLIDDRRIHVDFSQSVSKIRWKGKGRGVIHYDDEGSVIVDEKRIKTEGRFDNVRNREKNEKPMRRNENFKNNSDRYRRPSREREYKERSPNRNYANHRDNKNYREEGRYQNRSPDRKRQRSIEKYRQKSDHRRRSPPKDSERRYYERPRDDRYSRKDYSKHRSRSPERRKPPQKLSNSRKDQYDVSNGKSHNREIYHSKNKNYSEQYNKNNESEHRSQSNSKYLKRKATESSCSDDEPSTKKKKNSIDKKRKNSSTSTDESSDDEIRKKHKKNLKCKQKNRKKSSSSEDISTSSKKKTNKNKKKDSNKMKQSKNVPSSSNSSSSSSSSTDSEDSSTTSNSSDSGHGRSRKKSKNKKSVREKLSKKKSKK